MGNVQEIERGLCSRCRRSFQIRDDGMVRMHWTDGHACPGSGKVPGLHFRVDFADAGYMCLDFDGDVFALDDHDRAVVFDLIARISAQRAAALPALTA